MKSIIFVHLDEFLRHSNSRIILAAARAQIGIKDFRIHGLRYTCAAWLVTAGVPWPEVRDLLGHASITMTEKYAHLAPVRVRAAVTLIEGMSLPGHVGRQKTGMERKKALKTLMLSMPHMVGPVGLEPTTNRL